ncbi:DUF3285 domain-containing protein [Synechococcales cyanobacterium C]|uniref:DUF3285 domain-containing protein n=1 Tax=Petrachloros mirabilis ULC683 TaxID=2781853 RepID=A0A8K2A050_9CYAN|nr:DUF3285 domain-containing protein [Petrachloros mirabilis ULC683]
MTQTSPNAASEPDAPKPVSSTELTSVDPGAVLSPKTGQIEDPPPSFVKLAMRNMVQKSGQSLRHFGLTAAGLLGLLVGLAYLTR